MKLTEATAPQRFIPLKRPVVSESRVIKGKQVFTVEGIFGKLDAVNENHRRYPRSVVERNLREDSPFMRRIKRRGVLGELEHPESGNTHLERVALLITNTRIQQLSESDIKSMKLEGVEPGTYVVGSYEVLDTPKGKILRALHEANADIGISSRGRGDVKSVNGIDEVQEDYELDTYDAVYMPSVNEARPKVKMTEAEELGSALPDAAAETGAVGAPAAPTSTQPAGDWKKESEETIRALETLASSGTADIAEMVEVFNKALNLIDQLSSLNDEEAVKLKAQALSLTRVLTAKIMELETGKKADKKESLKEGNLTDLAATVDADRRKDSARQAKPVYKGELEAALNKAGHQPTPDKLQALSNELKRKGQNVQPEKYESIELDGKSIPQDGETVLVKAKDLETNDCNASAWLAKQTESVPVRVIRHGTGGAVVRMLEPAYAGQDIFVAFEKAKAVSESKTKEDGSMNVQVMMEELVRKNDALVKENAALKAQVGVKAKAGVPVRRYEAAKTLIRSLVDRCKGSEQKLIRESGRTKSAVKLIHKLVSERKGEAVDATLDETKKCKKCEKAMGKCSCKKESVTPVEKPVVTEASSDLQKRVVEASKGKTEIRLTEGTNLMSAIAQRIQI